MTNKELLTMVYEAKNNYDLMNNYASDAQKYECFRRTADTIITALKMLGHSINVRYEYDRKIERCKVSHIIISVGENKVCVMPCHDHDKYEYPHMFEDIDNFKKVSIKCYMCDYSTMRLYKQW